MRFEITKGYAGALSYRTFEDIAWLEPTNRYDERHQRYITGRPSQGFGDEAFAYAGKEIDPLPWHSHMYVNQLKARLERDLGVDFYFCLAGLYADETIGIPYHHDEIESDDDLIVSLSFGATRLFQNRKDSDGWVDSYIVENGDLMVFDGHSQRVSQHGVPALSSPCGPRINLTFRTKGRQVDFYERMVETKWT